MDNMRERDMHGQWDTCLMTADFWEDATRHAEQLARSERQALKTGQTAQSAHQSPTQSPSKNPIQTAVTSSPEKSPKKKSRFQLSQLASFNSLRLRSITHASPTGTDAANSPEKSPAKSQKSPKKGSLHLPKLPSFKTLSLKHRGPILASTSGIVDVQKPTRPSVLSSSTFFPPESPRPSILPPDTFLPPEYPIPPMPRTPRPAFRSLYRGPSAPKLDIAPPAPESSHPFATVAPTSSNVSFQEWLERQSDTRPKTPNTPHPAHSSRISLMAHINNGGTWDNIPRTRSVLELNMFFDARKVSSESLVDLDDDQSVDKNTMADEFPMVDKAIMTDSDLTSSTNKPTMVNKATMTNLDVEASVTDSATMTELDIEGSATDNLATDKATVETDVSMEYATNEPTTDDYLPTDKITAETDDIMKSDATIEDNVPTSKKTSDEHTDTDTEESTTPIDESSTNKKDKGKAAVHDWNVDSPRAIRKQDLPIFDAPQYPDQEVMLTIAAPNVAKILDEVFDDFIQTSTGDQVGRHSEKQEGEIRIEDEIRITILTLEQMRPLVEFRRLRVLKLTGMMRSYQPIIWQTVWVNPQLTTLELEMAVGPDIENPMGRSGWKAIKKGWVMNVRSYAPPVYYGNRGDGEICRKVGYGEYLDKYCIEKAKVLALFTGFPVPASLPVKHLTLTGFAVDGDAFGMWFRNLEEVHFKKDCIDCGFWLSRSQRDVRVRHSDEYVGVARGGVWPSAGSVEELGEEVLAELTAAVGGLGASM
ncbi:unnamed protein product [Penicillium glandicola]